MSLLPEEKQRTIYGIFLLFVSLPSFLKAKFQQAGITGNDDVSVPMCYFLQKGVYDTRVVY